MYAQLYQTLCDPLDCSPPIISVHGILQARILEWVSISFSRGSSRPKDSTCVSYIGRQILYHWATYEVHLPVAWTSTLLSEMSCVLGLWKRLVLIRKLEYFEKQPNSESKASKHLPFSNGAGWGYRGGSTLQWYFMCLLPKATGFSFSFILNHPLQTHLIVQIAKALKF